MDAAANGASQEHAHWLQRTLIGQMRERSREKCADSGGRKERRGRKKGKETSGERIKEPIDGEGVQF